MIVMRWNGMSLGGRKEGVDVKNTWRNGRSLLPPAAFCRTTAEKLEVFLVDVFEIDALALRVEPLIASVACDPLDTLPRRPQTLLRRADIVLVLVPH